MQQKSRQQGKSSLATVDTSQGLEKPLKSFLERRWFLIQMGISVPQWLSMETYILQGLELKRFQLAEGGSMCQVSIGGMHPWKSFFPDKYQVQELPETIFWDIAFSS